MKTMKKNFDYGQCLLLTLLFIAGCAEQQQQQTTAETTTEAPRTSRLLKVNGKRSTLEIH